MRKPSPSLVIAVAALFVALGGPATAAKLISGKKLRNNSVTSAKIRNRTLTATDISRSTLGALRRQSNSVTSANIVDGTIGVADMGASSVTGNQVADHTLTGVDIAADSLTGTEIATLSVGANELAADSVLRDKIKDGAISKPKIAGEAIASDEVRDGSLTAKDVGKATGTFTLDAMGTVPVNACKTEDVATNADLTNTIILVASRPGVIASAAATSTASARVTLCHMVGDAPADLDGDYPFVAFAP